MWSKNVTRAFHLCQSEYPARNFPGHRYISLGILLDNGKPIGEQITHHHNRVHHAAINSEHICAADRQAICNFAGGFVRTENWHSLVGATGLWPSAESVTGSHIYPKISGSCTAHTAMGDGTNREGSAKRSKMDEIRNNSFSQFNKLLHLPKTIITKRVFWNSHNIYFSKLWIPIQASQRVAAVCWKSDDSKINFGSVTTPLAYVSFDTGPCCLTPCEFKNYQQHLKWKKLSPEQYRLESGCSL